MSRVATFGAALACAAVVACKAPVSEPLSVPEARNVCEVDADCGEGGRCVTRSCFARRGELDAVVLEVVPESTSAYAAGLSFLAEQGNASTGDLVRDLALPRLAHVVGRAVAAPRVGAPCAYATSPDGSLAIRAELLRTSAPLGIPRASFAANATSDAAGALAFVGDVVPGDYDVRVSVPDDASCPVAPLLLRGVKLAGGDVSLALDLPRTRKLAGTVSTPAGTSLAGFALDVVDPALGARISTVATLGDGAQAKFAIEWRVPASGDVTPTDSGTKVAVGAERPAAESPFVRVAPPEGVVAPTTIWDLAAADLDGDGEIALDLSTVATSPVRVEGRMIAATDATIAVGGSLTITSVGPQSGLTAAFSRNVSVGDDGAFAADVPAGSYRVQAVPGPATNFAITETSWTIAATPARRSGVVIEVARKATLTGAARVPSSGAPLFGATIEALPSISVSSTPVLDAALGKTPVLPRPATAWVDENGRFALDVDPGNYDVAAVPPPASGYPWLVRPRFAVTAAFASAATPLDATTVLPVPLGGTITAPDGRPVPRALVRAYAVLLDAGVAAPHDERATGAVRVAETRADDAGRYRLLLPSALAR